jgi:hypothetical protein
MCLDFPFDVTLAKRSPGRELKKFVSSSEELMFGIIAACILPDFGEIIGHAK